MFKTVVFSIPQIILVAVVLPCVLAGCVHDRQGSHGHSILRSVVYSEDSIAALNQTANDQTKSQEDRARAIFTLFGRYVQPGCSSAEFHQVGTDVGWLQGAKLSRLGAYSGWIPIDDPFADTVFYLYLFADGSDKRASQWHIYFRLSGHLQQEDALAFLKGDGAARISTRMPQFALCLPHSIFHPDRAIGRIEAFSSAGVHIYEEMGR